MTNDVRWKRCCHGASTETELRVPTGLRQHPLRPVAYYIDIHDPALKSVPPRLKLPTNPRPRLYSSTVGPFPITNNHWTGQALRAREVDLFQVL